MGKSKVTMMDIAKKAGVSIATVSRVINGSNEVSPGLKRRIEQIVVEMKYNPKRKYSDKVNSTVTRIAILVNDFSDDVYPLLIKGILEATGSLKIELLLLETQRNKDKEFNYLIQLQKNKIDGIISVANLSNLNSEYEKLISQRFPIVFLVDPNDPTSPHRDDVHLVTSDNEGPFYATKYLLDLGHKNILYLGDSKIPRFKGYEKAIKSTGNSINPDLIVYCEDSFETARKCILENFKNGKFTAILAITEEIGMGSWFALTEMGVKIPEDCSVIGYNNKYANLLSFTTIAEPLIEMGRNAVYLLNDCMNNYQVNPRSIILSEKLIIRNSCKKL